MPENNIYPPADQETAVPFQEDTVTNVDPLSLQEILSMAIGVYVIVEFLIGTENMVTREGLLNSVGQGWLELYDEVADTTTICDLYSVKFVTFFQPGVRPYQAPQTMMQNQQSQQNNVFSSGRSGFRR